MSSIRDTVRRIRRKAPIAGGVGLAQLVGAVALALGTRLVTEFVNPSAYGSYKLVIGLVMLGNGLLLMPLIRFAMREIHDSPLLKTPSFVGSARRTVRVVAIATGGLGLLTATSITITGGERELFGWAVAAAALLVFQGQFSLETSLLTSTGRPALAAAFQAVASVLLPVLLVGAFVIHDAVASLVAAHAAVFGVLLLLVRRHRRGGTPGSVRVWLSHAQRFSLPLIPVAILTWLFSVGDRYLLAWLTDTETVGRYAAVYGLIATPLAIAGGIVPSLSYEPVFRLAAREDEIASRVLIRQVVAAQTMLIVLAVLLVIVLAPLGMDLLLAENYRAGARALVPWIAFGQGALVITYSLDLAAYAAKRTSTMAISYGVAVAVNISANLILIPERGAVGAAQATTLAGIAYMAMMSWLLYLGPRRTSLHSTSHLGRKV